MLRIFLILFMAISTIREEKKQEKLLDIGPLRTYMQSYDAHRNFAVTDGLLRTIQGENVTDEHTAIPNEIAEALCRTRKSGEEDRYSMYHAVTNEQRGRWLPKNTPQSLIR
jgi:hypothetical protein